MTEQNGAKRSATEVFRAMLDERGVEWWEGWYKDLTLFDGANGVRWMADYTLGELFLRSVLAITPEQAIAATLGPFYEPPVAAHWDVDVLTLTIPRDPSCIRVQRSTEQPCKVYVDESKVIAAMLGRRTCHKLPSSGETRCFVSRNGYEKEFGYWKCSNCGNECFEGAKYCMNCGAKAVDE